MSDTAESILDIAERMIRDGGYHSFSFRQIADELGIKSASIHYHYPSKEDLGLAVVTRYTEHFIFALGDPSKNKHPVKLYVDAFHGAFQGSCNPCLCGVMAGEVGKLAAPIRDTLQAFSEQNIRWLKEALKVERPDWSTLKRDSIASLIFSALEGAITFAGVTGQETYLKKVSNSILELLVDDSPVTQDYEN